MKPWKKILCLALALSLLAIPAQAEDLGGGESGDAAVGMRHVALTFDDGPSGAVTRALLDGLRTRYVPATFFLCGYRIEQYPDLVRQMAADEHELGLHGCSHTFMDRMSKAQIRDELETTSAMITRLTGQSPRLFRPPGGLMSAALLEEAARLELPIILWTLDPEDWKYQDAGRTVRYILQAVRDGDVILMHDLSKSSVAAAFQIIDTLQARGYQFCTVSELAALRGTTLQGAKKYSRFSP